MEAYRERDAMGRERVVERAIYDNCGAGYEPVAAVSIGSRCSDCNFAGVIRENLQGELKLDDELEIARFERARR